MIDVNYILDMLDWKKDDKTQEEGLKLARSVKNINVFLQPSDSCHNKNVWDNCAVVLSEKTDEELTPYLMDLFEWLQDMNWPGAINILERLNKFAKTDVYKVCYENSVKRAKATSDEVWLKALYQIESYEGENLKIEEIMNMISSENSLCIQANGRELAKSISRVNVFIQPISDKFGKNVWNNCAIILAERKDEELELYLWELLEWLQSLDTPGALIISDRLKKYTRKSFVKVYSDAISSAIEKYDQWAINLALLFENPNVVRHLDKELYGTIEDIYKKYWR